MYQRMMTGPKPENTAGIRDLNLREAWVVAPIVIAIVGLGVYPKPVLDVISPTVQRTMSQVGVTDPGPLHGTPVAEGTAK
jgi:NADH-quinone oxidoreductase subunit M